MKRNTRVSVCQKCAIRAGVMGKIGKLAQKNACSILYKKIKNISCKKENKLLAFWGRVCYNNRVKTATRYAMKREVAAGSAGFSVEYVRF